MDASGKIPLKRAGPREPQPLDRQVGARIRAKRKVLRITQQDLAARIGVSFQQLQKYEKGRNRIGASRLQRVADVLDVPMSYFFDEWQVLSRDEITHVLGDFGTPRLIGAWGRLPPKVKRSLVSLIERIAATAAAETGRIYGSSAPSPAPPG